MHYFYIFKCKDGTLYCGSTSNLVNREKLHNSGKGAKYTRSRGGGVIVYSEKCDTKSLVLKREAQVKKWARSKKLDMIETKGV